MFIRATLAVAVIAMLLPHEPNLGLGRPATLTAIDSNSAVEACLTLGGSETSCSAVASAAAQGDLQAFVFDKLRAVKAELAANNRTPALAENLVGGERGDADQGLALPPSSSR